MNYKRFLIISIFVHGVAVAGSYFLGVAGFGQPQTVKSVDVLFVEKVAQNSDAPSPKKHKKIRYQAQENSVSPPEQDEKPVFAEAGDLAPDQSNEPVVYPEEARRQGLEGQALVTLTVNGQGGVVDVRFSEPLPNLLAQEVLKTMKQWRFRRFKTTPSYVNVQVPVVFSLTDGG